MEIKKNYTGTVVEENGELFLVFEKEIMDELGWREGDNVVWEIDDNANVVLVKREIE